jgi:hypothetical protein
VRTVDSTKTTTTEAILHTKAAIDIGAAEIRTRWHGSEPFHLRGCFDATQQHQQFRTALNLWLVVQ